MRRQKRLITGLLLALLTGAGAAVVRADCVQTNAPAADGIFDCTGTDTNGINTGGGADTVTIAAGATVGNAAAGATVGAIESAGAVTITLGAGATLLSELEGAGAISAGGNVILTGGAIFSDDFNEIGLETNGQAVLNNVTITTQGFGAEAVETDGVTTFNSGLITTSGFDGEGIHTLSFGAIMNGGTIITSNGDAEGIESAGDVFMTGGTIITTGDGSEGIDSLASVFMTGGTISTTGGTTTGECLCPVTAYGILAADNITITGGSITSTGVAAVQGTTNNNTITIDIGAAAINGVIDGGGGTDTLILQGSTDSLVSFNLFQNCAAVPATCSTPGVIYTVTSGGQTFQFRNFQQFTSTLTYVPGPPPPPPPPPSGGTNTGATNSGTTSSPALPPYRANDGRINPDVGDWLIAIYGQNAGQPGILVYGGSQPLWIPAALFPAAGKQHQTIACTASGDVCAYRLTTGEFQVNAAIGIHRTVVIFDGLTPTRVYYGR